MLATALIMPESGHAQEIRKFEIIPAADLVSSYVWRGAYQTGASVQPSLNLSYAGVSLTAWGSTDFATAADEVRSKEFDLTLGYTVKGFKVAVTDYWWAGEGNRMAISHVFLTTNLAAAAGGFLSLIVAWVKYKKPSLSLTLNGVLAGLVGITAGCDVVSPAGAALIGALCGTVMIFAVDFIDHVLKIDDPVGASSVHGVCGFLGTILTGLFATGQGWLYGAGPHFFLAQLFGALVIGCWAAGMGFVVFKGLDLVHGLRVPARVEEEGLDIYEHGETAYNS